MSFDWSHPEYTAKCFIIVTINEIHRLILDIFLKLGFKKLLGLHCQMYYN